MLNFCLLMAPILLLWRQWGIAFHRWSNILIIYYVWFSSGTNLWSIQDEYIACIYFQFRAPSGYYVYIFLFSIVLFWTLSVYGITYWNASHTYWRHYIYNMLLAFNTRAYEQYPSDYKEDLFKRWFKRQKRNKFFKSIISHHFVFYLMCYEFVDFYNYASPVDWYAVSQFFDKYFYFWCLSFYIITLFRSIFVSNFYLSHMYFFSNNLFFEGISDIHYFINDSSYSSRLRKETMPMSKSGFRQVSGYYNSKWRMFRVRRYYLMDRNLEHGRFLLPITWINFKYETYDFISASLFYKAKSRFQHFWFRIVRNMSYVKRVNWRKTLYIRRRKKYRSSFYLKKRLDSK